MNQPDGGSTRGPRIQVSAPGADIPQRKTSDLTPPSWPRGASYITTIWKRLLMLFLHFLCFFTSPAGQIQVYCSNSSVSSKLFSSISGFDFFIGRNTVDIALHNCKFAFFSPLTGSFFFSTHFAIQYCGIKIFVTQFMSSNREKNNNYKVHS